VPDFLLPDLGEGLEEAEVTTWRVQVGDRVTVDQVIAEVETAKAVVEVPVPYAGTVARLHAEPGGTVSVGQPLITVTADRQTEDQSAEEPSGSVLIGYGTTSAPARKRRGSRRGLQNTVPVPAASGRPGPAVPSRPGRVAVISPLVRKLARDAGLDLGSLAGTGPAGVISRADVRRAIAGRTVPLQQPPAAADAPLIPPPAAATALWGERRIPLRGARRAAAEKLARSRREIPEATVWVDVDATGLVEARRALNARDPGRPVSLLALLARFAIAGLGRYPELNARVEADEIVLTGRVNLGFAAQTEHGLLVPVVSDAHLLTTRDLSARLAERTAAARERRLTPADLSGGTFTVNNYGVFGVDGSAAIINHPEVAILGIGRVTDRPWVVDGQLVVRKVTELTLAFDHRVADGGTAGGFLRYVADCVESPAAALGDM
jgi:2-oxoisovalerate dehydrogenase E2 component (dihydrolipoyl transacylase)